MATYVKKVMTESGPVQIDYKSLANLPTIDATIIDGSKNAVQGNAVYDAISNINTQLSKKLDATNGKAADSEKLGGHAPSYFATASDVQTIAEELGLKLDGSIEDTAENLNKIQEALNAKFNAQGQALDAAKLGGQDPSYYATKQEAQDAQATANAAQSAITSVTAKMGTQVTYKLEGTVLTITTKE